MKIIKIACLIIITLCSYLVFISIYRDYNDKIIRNIAYKDKIAENSITDSLIVSLEENKDNLEEKLENEFNIKLDEDIDNLIKDDSLTATDQENLYNEYSLLLEEEKNLTEEQEILKNQYDSLLNSTLNDNNKVDDKIINGIPTLLQYPKYPTGCESVALTILLNYYGYNTTPDNVISKLKLGLYPYKKDGIYYGGHPEIEFIGNPYEKLSYGVYENPILDVAKTYNSNFVSGTGKSLKELLDLVDKGIPSLVWVSIKMCVPYVSTSWIYEATGETIYWKSGEHAVVLIGYNDSSVIVSDPDTGNINYYNYDVFNNRYEYYGRKNIYLGG